MPQCRRASGHQQSPFCWSSCDGHRSQRPPVYFSSRPVTRDEPFSLSPTPRPPETTSLGCYCGNLCLSINFTQPPDELSTLQHTCSLFAPRGLQTSRFSANNSADLRTRGSWHCGDRYRWKDDLRHSMRPSPARDCRRAVRLFCNTASTKNISAGFQN